MSELRDARLQRALASAPDADLRPEARTREAVRRAAMEAVGGAAVREAAPVQRSAQPAAPTGWRRLWSALWPSAGTAGSAQRMPWNAALATVLLASLVTLLWRDEDIPGAEPGLEHAGQPVPATPAEAPVVAASPPPAATRPVPDTAIPSAPKAALPAGKAQPAATADASSNATAVDAARPAGPAKPSVAAPPAPVAAERQRDARSEPLAEAAPAGPARESRSAFAKSAPPSQAAALADAARPPAQAQAPAVAQGQMAAAGAGAAAPPLPAPVPAPAAPPPAAPAAPAALSATAPAAKAAAPAGVGAAMSRRAETAAPMPDAWTQARILDGSGRGVQIDRAQAPALAGLLRAALVGGPAGDWPFGTPTLRLELLQSGQRLGMLEVAGPLLRWTPAAADGSAGAVRLVQPDAAALQALVDELARWAGR